MSPFKSTAQKKKFEEMVAEGKITQAVFDEWNTGTPEKMPERVEKPVKPRRTKYGVTRAQNMRDKK